MKKIFQKNDFWIPIFLITVVSALAFLPFANKMGFYFNDWHLLSGDAAGVNYYFLFEFERPGVGKLYELTWPLFGAHPFAWQIFTFVLRLGGVICFYLILRNLWPEQKLQTTLASLLMAVYPGFLQQPIAVTFSNHFITQGAALLSIFFTVLSLQSKKLWKQVLFVLMAMGLELCYLFVYEYMLGFEVLRLLFIGVLIHRQKPNHFLGLLWGVSKKYIPYLLPLFGFLVWRLFFFVSSRPTTDLRVLMQSYRSDLPVMLMRLILETIRDGIETGFLAWGVPFYQSLSRAASWLVGLSLGLGIIAGLLVFIHSQSWQKNGGSDEARSDWLWIGSIGLIAAVFPVVLSNREVRFDNLLDRYTLQAAPSVALLLSGLIYKLFRPSATRWMHIILVFSAVSAMVANGYPYVQRWEAQRNLWWQLSWRAPLIKEDTTLVAVLPPGLRLMEASEIWTAANHMYYPNQKRIVITAEVLDTQILPRIQSGQSFDRFYRNVAFINEFDKTLLVALPTLNSCLHVFDGNQVESAGGEDLITLQSAPFSSITQIEVDKNPPQQPDFLGREPEHGWCYDYQKASLARQQGDWQEVTRLADEALAEGLAPVDLSEWLPFIEGYWNVGREADALKLTDLIRADEPAQQSICANLAASRNPNGGYSDESIFQKMLSELCEP